MRINYVDICMQHNYMYMLIFTCILVHVCIYIQRIYDSMGPIYLS